MCNFFKKLFGNKKNNKHILDGPGMVNPFVWKKITVSRSDSYAQHNFSITAVNNYPQCILTGTLRDDNGIYEEEDGIVLKGPHAEKIRNCNPDSLPDVVNIECNEEIGDMLEEVEILDDSYVNIVVYYADGTEQKKVDEDSFSLKFYQAVLPYFRKKCKNIL